MPPPARSSHPCSGRSDFHRLTGGIAVEQVIRADAVHRKTVAAVSRWPLAKIADCPVPYCCPGAQEIGVYTRRQNRQLGKTAVPSGVSEWSAHRLRIRWSCPSDFISGVSAITLTVVLAVATCSAASTVAVRLPLTSTWVWVSVWKPVFEIVTSYMPSAGFGPTRSRSNPSAAYSPDWWPGCGP